MAAAKWILTHSVLSLISADSTLVDPVYVLFWPECDKTCSSLLQHLLLKIRYTLNTM